MSRTKIIAAVIAGVLTVAALSGCAPGAPADAKGGDAVSTSTETGWISARVVNLPNGGTVVCVYYSSAISCDWAGAK